MRGKGGRAPWPCLPECQKQPGWSSRRSLSTGPCDSPHQLAAALTTPYSTSGTQASRSCHLSVHLCYFPNSKEKSEVIRDQRPPQRWDNKAKTGKARYCKKHGAKGRILVAMTTCTSLTCKVRLAHFTHCCHFCGARDSKSGTPG